MKEVRYFVFQYGSGVGGRRGTKSLKLAVWALRRRLRKNATPLFTVVGHDGAMTLASVAEFITKALVKSPGSHKEVVRGAHYDERAYTIVKQVTKPVKSPMVSALEPFVGRSPYELGAVGPPGQSDCSSSSSYAAEKAYGIKLPHSANEQGHLPDRFFYFTNVDDLQSGDFIFYKYTNRVGGAPDDYDHVDICVQAGVSIGSRPSTNGIGYYHWLNGPGGDRPDFAALKYGRLRTA